MHPDLVIALHCIASLYSIPVLTKVSQLDNHLLNLGLLFYQNGPKGGIPYFVFVFLHSVISVLLEK